jgi:hypothetical protein
MSKEVINNNVELLDSNLMMLADRMVPVIEYGKMALAISKDRAFEDNR